MRYFPIFVDLAHRDVLIAGGGEQAVQKARLLLKTEARITLVAERFNDELLELAREDRVTLVHRAFEPTDVAGCALVFAATGDEPRNAEVAAAARSAGIPINAVDEPRHSSFIMPAIVDRDPVTVAIGTEGASPVLAREIKTHLDAWLPARLGVLARTLGHLRDRVAAEIAEPAQRRRLWERLLKGPFRRAALDGDRAGTDEAFTTELARAHATAVAPGRIVLVGCGPGDPDLLTLKAQQALQDADVLVIDRLVPDAILDYARRDAQRIPVGKTPGGPSTSQEEINRILVREGLKGKVVARLKGGDAFVFGRAAEEMAAARAAGLDVEVVPGITAAHACAARIGLPLTLRQKVRRFAVLTGATAEGEAEHDWKALAAEGQAFAIYMGIASAPAFRRKLLAAGASTETTVVIVENGTLDSERTVEATLGDLDAVIAAERLTGPAIIFVGLDWEEALLSRPASVKVFRQNHLSEQAVAAAWTPERVAEATHWVMG